MRSFSSGAVRAAGAAVMLVPYANTDLRTTEVMVNGHESPFIFDTGAGLTILTPEQARFEVRAKTGTLWMEVDSGNNGPVFLAPHAQQQLGISIAAHGKRQLDLDVIGLGPVPVTAASRDLIYDGQLDPAFLRQIQLTVDIEHGRAWASFNEPMR